jgi:hypothetical protein
MGSESRAARQAVKAAQSFINLFKKISPQNQPVLLGILSQKRIYEFRFEQKKNS